MVDPSTTSAQAALVQYQSSLWTWSVVGLILLVCLSVVFSVRQYLKLRHIDGPPIAAWTSLWYIRNAISGRLYYYQLDTCNKYGSIVRIAPNTLVTCDEDLIRAMNAVRSPFGKSYWYKAFRFDAEKDNLVSVIDEKLHDAMRIKLSPGYGGKDNPNLEGDIDSGVWSLINLIKRKYISKDSDVKRFDFARAAQFLALDVITAAGLGSSFGWLEDDEDKFDYVKTWTANIPIVSFMAAVPPLAWLMSHPAIQPYLVPSVKERSGLGAVKAAARERVSHRFGESKEYRDDMVQSFIKHGLSETEIADETLLQIVAGSDTTSTVLRTAVQYILSNPHVYRRLQQECDSVDLPINSIITDAKASKLPYLTACIRESLRIRTPTPGMLPRIVPKEGYTHKGIFLPGGTEIGMSLSNVQLNPLTFGADVHTFRPERWLLSEGGGLNPEQLARMERANDLNFSHGRFRCLGERLAKMELYKTVFELFRRFEMQFVDSMKPVEWEANYGLWYMQGMWLRVEERERFSS